EWRSEARVCAGKRDGPCDAARTLAHPEQPPPGGGRLVPRCGRIPRQQAAALCCRHEGLLAARALREGVQIPVALDVLQGRGEAQGFLVEARPRRQARALSESS